MHRNAVAVSAAARELGLEVEIREFPDGTTVWAAAGTPHHVFSVAPAALVSATCASPDLAKRVAA